MAKKTEKTKSKGKAAKAEAPEVKAGRGRKRGEIDTDLVERIVEMRDEDGKKFAQIAEELGIQTGKAQWFYEYGKLPKKERVSFDTEKELGQWVVDAREDEKLSWGRMSMRTGLAEGRLRNLYAQFAKNPDKGKRIGRGGRYAEGDERPEPKEKTSKKEAKASGKAKAAAGKAATKNPLEDLDLDGLRKRLTGKIVTTGAKSGEEERYKIEKIKSLKKGIMTVVDDDDDEVMIEVADIKKATK